MSGVETVKAFKNVEKQSHSDRAENTSEPPSVAEDFTNKQRNSPNLAKGIFTEDAAKSPTDIVQVATDDSSNDRLCCMCDQEVNVRLSPCGHTVMCSDCAHIAKRCPTCRVSACNVQPHHLFCSNNLLHVFSMCAYFTAGSNRREIDYFLVSIIHNIVLCSYSMW